MPLVVLQQKVVLPDTECLATISLVNKHAEAVAILPLQLSPVDVTAEVLNLKILAHVHVLTTSKESA